MKMKMKKQGYHRNSKNSITKLLIVLDNKNILRRMLRIGMFVLNSNICLTNFKNKQSILAGNDSSSIGYCTKSTLSHQIILPREIRLNMITKCAQQACK